MNNSRDVTDNINELNRAVSSTIVFPVKVCTARRFSDPKMVNYIDAKGFEAIYNELTNLRWIITANAVTRMRKL